MWTNTFGGCIINFIRTKLDAILDKPQEIKSAESSILTNDMVLTNQGIGKVFINGRNYIGVCFERGTEENKVRTVSHFHPNQVVKVEPLGDLVKKNAFST